jgi:hypothetical protein
MRFPSIPVEMVPALQELSDMVNVFGRIMEQEGVPKETRDRVVHTFIFGTPEVPDQGVGKSTIEVDRMKIEAPDTRYPFPPFRSQGGRR